MPDTDTDGDGKADCVDTCPLDGRKSAPGQCGCGNPDVDIDGDGVAACLDQCSNDNKKTSPGICGCGVADTDSDGDGIVDCLDGCSADSKKASPGLCGCGVSDVDSDGDGVPDCKDLCVADATKQSPGKCGCGISDVDSDGDGVPNCQDLCPSDARKTSPGSLGCGRVESSTSVVVTPVVSAEPQKIQTCAAGSIKSEPGACGCSVLDTDVNKNGVIDCKEPSKLALPVAAVVSVKMRTLKVTLPTFNGVTFELTFTKGAKRRVVVSQTALLTFKNFERGAWVLRYRMLLAGGVDRTPPSARARFEVK